MRRFRRAEQRAKEQAFARHAFENRGLVNEFAVVGYFRVIRQWLL